MRLRNFGLAAFSFALFFLALDVAGGIAQIYVYRDDNGVYHFTNTPDSPKYKPFGPDFKISRRAPKSLPAKNPQRYDRYISQAARIYGISFSLLKSVIKVESNFNPRAVSQKGAKGLMQIMPANYKTLSIKNPFDPWENIQGGTRYLKQLLKRYQGKLELALAAYNAGPELVDEYRRVPPYRETRNYVRQVLRHYKAYKER